MNIVIPKPVNEILNILYENNYDGYLVGGTIRNMVLGEKPKKYNISTNASIDSLRKILKNYETSLCGENNRTLSIANNKFPMEITPYGTKENTLESYLKTKDFTMNALAYSDEDGLVDYATGIIDIKNDIIKLNGEDDENLKTDPLRILRAIRLSGEYKMRIDPQTIEYMFDNKELLKNVASERVRDELCKILSIEKCSFYLKKYLDIFLVVIPELTLMENFNQNNPYHIYDVLEHTFVALKSSENNLNVRLVLLFHDIAKPLTYIQDKNGIGHFPNHEKKGADMTREILNRLKFNKRTIQIVTKVIEYHDTDFPIKENNLKQFLAKFNTEELEVLFKAKKADTLGKNPAFMSEYNKIDNDYERVKNILKQKECIKKNELRISGKELLNLGVPQEDIGKNLDLIYSAVLNNELKNDKDVLVSYAVKNILPSTYDE